MFTSEVTSSVQSSKVLLLLSWGGFFNWLITRCCHVTEIIVLRSYYQTYEQQWFSQVFRNSEFVWSLRKNFCWSLICKFAWNWTGIRNLIEIHSCEVRFSVFDAGVRCENQWSPLCFVSFHNWFRGIFSISDIGRSDNVSGKFSELLQSVKKKKYLCFDLIRMTKIIENYLLKVKSSKGY